MVSVFSSQAYAVSYLGTALCANDTIVKRTKMGSGEYNHCVILIRNRDNGLGFHVKRENGEKKNIEIQFSCAYTKLVIRRAQAQEIGSAKSKHIQTKTSKITFCHFPGFSTPDKTETTKKRDGIR